MQHAHALPEPFLRNEAMPVPAHLPGLDERAWVIYEAENICRKLWGQVPEEVALQQRGNRRGDKEQFIRRAVAQDGR